MKRLGDIVRDMPLGPPAPSNPNTGKDYGPEERAKEEGDEWMDACAKGDCTYPDPFQRPVDRLMCVVPPGCPGYRIVTRIEYGKEVTRTGLCGRHRAWWKQEQVRIRERRAREAARFAALKAGTTPRRRADLDDD